MQDRLTPVKVLHFELAYAKHVAHRFCEAVMGNRLNRINIDLGQYKQPFVAYCRVRAESPSSLFR